MKQGWEIIPFEDSIVKVKYTTKIPSNDYLEQGSYPIVSQEEGLISGYWNNEDDVFKVSTPVVIFGDHTRILKYVDFDFVLGADGVKILQPIKSIDAKFFKLYLESCKIPSLGYSRHYKLLKELQVPIPPREEQERIVAELDCLSGVIEKKREQLKQLDALAQSIFYQMFGDPITNEKGWEVKKLGEVCKTTSGGTPSKGHNEYYEGGTIPWLRSGEVNKMYIYDTELFITEEGLQNSSAKWFPENTVVVAMYGATVGQVGILKSKMTTNQAICGIFPNEYFIPTYLYHFLLSKKEEYLKLATGGAQPNISQNIVRDTLVCCPPIATQQEFADKIEAIEKQKELIKQSITQTEELFNSRMDYYFN